MAPLKCTIPFTVCTDAFAAPNAPFVQPLMSVNGVEPAFAIAGASSVAQPTKTAAIRRLHKTENI
jgi:hypothetical protein